MSISMSMSTLYSLFQKEKKKKKKPSNKVHCFLHIRTSSGCLAPGAMLVLRFSRVIACGFWVVVVVVIQRKE